MEDSSPSRAYDAEVLAGDLTILADGTAFCLKADTELAGEIIISPNASLETRGFKIFAPDNYHIEHFQTPDGGHKIKCVMGNGADWETQDL